MSDETDQRPFAVITSIDRVNWATVAQILTAAVLVALPLLMPLGIGRDYPNHLARVFIQNTLTEHALLSTNYVVEFFIVPDLAMDLFARPLAGLMDSYQIGAVFNAITLLLLFSAVVALHRRLSGGVDVWPCLAAAVLFNAALLWGFMNFLFGAGLALWLFYAWVRTSERQSLVRLLIFSVAQVVLFFCHLMGFLFLGYLILVWELARMFGARGGVSISACKTFVLNMLQFVVPVGLFLQVLLGQEGVGSSATRYGDLSAKAAVFLSPTAALGQIAGPLILLGCLCLGYWLLRSGHAKIARPMIPIVLAVLALTILMPNMVFGVWGLDFRFPFLLLLLTIASIQITATGMTRRIASLACMALTITALGAAALAFHRTDRIHQDIRDAVATMQPSSNLLVAGSYPPSCPNCLDGWGDYIHAGSLAAIESQAFVPLLFTATSFVKASEAKRALDVPYGTPLPRQALEQGLGRPLPPATEKHNPARRYWYDWPNHFDYVLWLRVDDGEMLDQFDQLTAVVENEGFVLYRVIRTSSAADRSIR